MLVVEAGGAVVVDEAAVVDVVEGPEVVDVEGRVLDVVVLEVDVLEVEVLELELLDVVWAAAGTDAPRTNTPKRSATT